MTYCFYLSHGQEFTFFPLFVHEATPSQKWYSLLTTKHDSCVVNIPGGFKSFPWALHICKKILPQLNFVCRLLFGVRSNPLLPQWHEKEPGHSTNSAGGRLHLNMHEPLTQRSRSGLTRLLSRHSVGTYQEMSSHATHQGTLGQLSELAEPLWTDPGLKGGISVRELISTLKKNKKKQRWGMNCRTFSPNPHMQAKIYHHHHISVLKSA